MATVIRFARHGSKKRPYFRIVVQDKRAPRDGRFIDHIGSFQPTKGVSSVTVARDRLSYWLSVGAEMSNSVKNRLKSNLAELRTGAVAAQPSSDKRSPEAR